MSYLLMGILLLLIAGAFVTYLVMTATKRSDHATAADSDSAAPGIGADESPLGDTKQHAGEQDLEGRTVGGTDTDDTRPDTDPAPPGRFQRDPVGGEAEARPFSESER
jgi:hypothetical protein